MILFCFNSVINVDTLTLRGDAYEGLSDSVTGIAGTIAGNTAFIGSNTSSIEPEPLVHAQHEWLLLVLLAMAGTVAIINFISSGRVPEIFAMVFSVDKWKKYFYESVASGQGVVLSSIFFINFLVASSILFYLSVLNFVPDISLKINFITLFAYIVLFLLAYVIFLNIIIAAVNKILGQEMITRVHLRINNYLWYITGIILLPLMLIYLYTSSVIWLEISLSVFALFFVLKMIIFIIVAVKNFPVSGFQIFLYLCTLEILPLTVVIKFLSLNVL